MPVRAWLDAHGADALPSPTVFTDPATGAVEAVATVADAVRLGCDQQVLEYLNAPHPECGSRQQATPVDRILVCLDPDELTALSVSRRLIVDMWCRSPEVSPDGVMQMASLYPNAAQTRAALLALFPTATPAESLLGRPATFFDVNDAFRAERQAHYDAIKQEDGRIVIGGPANG